MHLSASNITVRYGRRAVLDGVDVDIVEGGLTAVMGPNGCGKTTLLRCLGGLLKPDHGRVEFDGVEIGSYSARQLAQRIAYVHQHPYIDFDFTAFEIVLMGRNPYQNRLQGESQADLDLVEQSMRQTGTWHLRHSRPGQMSGGELQRVMIARALAQHTPLLLMDEPVSNLDISHQIEIMRLLRQSQRTVVIVIHDLGLALHYCDRVLLLHQGKPLFDGPITEGLTPERIKTVYSVGASIEKGHVLLDYE